VTERTIILGAALLLVALASLAMAGLHERHYKNRRWLMLEARLAVLERIVAGEHE
jgi:hypothetical protein